MYQADMGTKHTIEIGVGIIMNIKYARYALVAASFFISADVYADDPYATLQEMVNDLGGDMAQVYNNNGKTIKCAQGGTKKISIKFGKNASIYSAYYDKCRENDDIRDVIYEIETVGEDVVKNKRKSTINRELFDAAISNDSEKVRLQLKNNADVNTTYNMPVVAGGEIERWTPLMSAASNGNLNILKLLINKGAWVNYMNSEVKSALWYATYSGKADVVKYLLEHGAYVNNSDLANTTPLMIAAMNGDTEVVKVLIAHRADVNLKQKDGDTALMVALAHGNSDIAKILIKAGADLNVKNKEGVTALIICAVENNVEVAKLLIMNNANTKTKTDFGKTALDIASAKGHAQLVHILSEIK